MTIIDGKTYYTPADVAKKYSIPQINVYFWIKNGKIASRRIGKRILIEESVVVSLFK